MNKEKISNIISVLVLTILICMSIAFLYTYYNIDSLKQEIEKRDLTIEILNKKDSLRQSIIGNPKSIQSKTDIVASGDLVKYANEMSDVIDSLYHIINQKQKEINNLNDSLSYYKIYYNLSQKKFNHNYIVKKNASGGRNYSFEPNSIPKADFKKSQDEVLSLTKEINEIKKSQNIYAEATKKYGIKFKNIKNESVNGCNYEIYSPKLDSALMLLPVYGNKLKFNSKENEWSVGGKMFIKYITIEQNSAK